MTRIAFALLLALGFAGCIASESDEPRPAAPTSTPANTSTASGAPAGACDTDYPAAPLPQWARSGFSDPDPSVPHVLSDKGDIVAVVWVSQHPLTSPPAADKSNKILWVARVGAARGPLRIRAVQQGTAETVSRVVEPAPGPSIIDLPSPGCWSFDLTWGRHHDHMQLGYISG